MSVAIRRRYKPPAPPVEMVQDEAFWGQFDKDDPGVIPVFLRRVMIPKKQAALALSVDDEE